MWIWLVTGHTQSACGLLLPYTFSLPSCTRKTSSLILILRFWLIKIQNYAFILLSLPSSPSCFLLLFLVGLHLLGPSPVIKTSVEQQMRRPMFFWVLCLIKLLFLYAWQQVQSLEPHTCSWDWRVNYLHVETPLKRKPCPVLRSIYQLIWINEEC